MIYLVVINPVSGDSNKKSLTYFLQEQAQSKGFDLEIFETTGNNDYAKLEEKVESLNPDKLLVAGGDGTLLMAAEVVKGKNIPIGLFPVGSANGMAAELDLPTMMPNIPILDQQSFKRAWRIIEEGHSVKVDVVSINGEYSIHLADVGLNAEIVKGFDESDSRGFATYAHQFFQKYTSKKAFSYSVRADDGRLYRGEAYMLSIANARMFGTGAIINPRGNVSDGTVELCVIKEASALSILKSAGSIITGNVEYDADQVEVISVKKATIELDPAQSFQIDGELQKPVSKIDVSILPSVVEVYCSEDFKNQA
jgi:diacylglycerol kinase family enzyme